jgi:hypothetical protein
MISLSCPSCRRPLSLPDHLKGSWVKCPGCKNTFQAPAEVAVVEEVQAVEAVPEPAVPGGGAFAFESEKAGYRRVRVQTQVRGAVGYLYTNVFLHFLLGVWCLANSLLAGVAFVSLGALPLPLLVIPLVLLYYVPLVFMFLGAGALSRCSSHAMPMTGAVMAFVLAALALILTVLVLLGLYAHFNPIGCVVLLLTVSAVITGILGGVSTIQALNHPDVSRLIERNMDRDR